MEKNLATILTGLYLFLIAPASFAQDTLKLTLTPLSEPRFNVTYGGLKLKNTDRFRGIPNAMDHQVFIFNFQRQQSSLTNYQKGILTDQDFKQIVETYGIDTVGLYRKTDINNSLAVLSALYPGNRKMIIPDLNFNLDFSDDLVYEYTVPDFDSEYPTDSLPTLRVSYDYMIDNKRLRRDLLFKIPPTSRGHTPVNPDDKPLLMNVKYSPWQSTRITFAGTPYEITIGSPPEPDAKYTLARALIVKDLTTGKNLEFKPYLTPGVFFPLGGKMVKVDNISHFGESAQLIVK